MRETQGDLWSWDDGQVVARTITTNGFVTSTGDAVLGRGVAKQAVERFGLPLRNALGDRLRRYGNHLHSFAPNPGAGRPYWLLTFPVKPVVDDEGGPGFKAKAELGIIERSAAELLHWTLGMLDAGGTIVLPRPGCGNGGLQWEDVRPVLAEVLDQPVLFAGEREARSIGDRFVVVHP